MKILQLRSTRPPRFPIELHPQLTVIRGLGGSLRLELADTFTSIAAGRPVSMFGMIEAHGVQLDLDAAALRVVLGLGNEALTPVLRGGDLPVPQRDSPAGEEAPDVASARRLLAQTLADLQIELEQAEARRDDLAGRSRRHLSMLAEPPAPDLADDIERRQADEAVAQAEEAVRTAERAMAEAARIIDDHRADLEAASRLLTARARHARTADALARTVAALEGARSGVDPGVIGALRVAVARQAELQEEHDGDPTVRAWSSQGSEATGDSAGDKVSEPSDVPKETSPEQRNAVRAALRLAETVVESIPSPEALRLAERWARATAHQSAGGTGSGADDPPPSPEQVESARSRVHRAASTLASLEADRTPFELDEEAAAEVRAAHVALLAAQERAGKHFKAARGKRASRAVELAAETERHLLDGLGFASYAEFAISASGRIRAGGNDGRMHTARVNLAQAQTELAGLTARLVGNAPAASEESAPLARLRNEAKELLTFEPGPDVGRALRSPPPDKIPEFVRLMAALEEVGVSATGLDLDLAGWCDLARRWLDGPDKEIRDGGSSGRRVGVPVPRARQRDLDRSHHRATERARRLRELSLEISTLQMRAVVHGDAVTRTADLELAIASSKAHEQTAAEAVRLLELEHAQREGEIVAVAEAAQAALVDARSQSGEAIAARRALGEPSTPEAVGAELIETQRQLMSAAADVARLQARRQPLLADLAEMDRQIATQPAPPETTKLEVRRKAKGEQASQLEEIEWYLLARLAGQRSESIAGSIPLLLDDPFADIPSGMVRQLLGWLERMAAAVQVVILTDHPEAAAWVSTLSPERGALIHAPAPES